MRDYLLDVAVALRRNYADLPFDADENAETAREVNVRAQETLQRVQDTYAYRTLRDMDDEEKRTLREYRLLCAEADDAVASAAYLRTDRTLCVQTAGMDHLFIAANAQQDMMECLRLCSEVAEQLQQDGQMAKSEEYGFLTARPCDAGTGMRASALLHLPMMTLARQIPVAMKISAAAGMILRGENGGAEGRNAGLYVLENRVTLGKTAEEIVREVQLQAKRLVELEEKLRMKARETGDVSPQDASCRAYGIARYARKVTQKEALQLWSGMTLGCALGVLDCSDEQMEKLWKLSRLQQKALLDAAGKQGVSPDVLRARRIRDIVTG